MEEFYVNKYKIDGFKSDMKLTLIFKLKFYQGEK